MTNFIPTEIPGSWLFEGVRYHDNRGWFQELFKYSSVIKGTGLDFHPVQINLSTSVCGVIRGIHYSVAQEGQGKYVSVIDGEVDDYIIDVREGSPTFGKWLRVRLSSELGNGVLLGPNLAHAFQAISGTAIVSYAVTAEFNPAKEYAINPFCEELQVAWNKTLTAITSPKDREAPNLSEARDKGALPIFK